MGFQCNIFPVVILAFVQPFYSMRASAMIAVAAQASLLVLMYVVVGKPPLYQLDSFWFHVFLLVTWSIFPLVIVAMVLPFIAESWRPEQEIDAAYGESESLLLNILPAPIAARPKRTAGMIAYDHDRVAILFADIVGFTDMSIRLSPAEVVGLLNRIVNACDALTARYGAEKIKTIGDAYMVVAGLTPDARDPAAVLAAMALDMQENVARFRVPGAEEPVRLHIGLNAVRVVAGVIGQRKFAYDLWGDAVNVAACMEVTGEPGRIRLSDDLAGTLADRFTFTPRGPVEVKGKGLMHTSFLTGRRAAA